MELGPERRGPGGSIQPLPWSRRHWTSRSHTTRHRSPPSTVRLQGLEELKQKQQLTLRLKPWPYLLTISPSPSAGCTVRSVCVLSGSECIDAFTIVLNVHGPTGTSPAEGDLSVKRQSLYFAVTKSIPFKFESSNQIGTV